MNVRKDTSVTTFSFITDTATEWESWVSAISEEDEQKARTGSGKLEIELGPVLVMFLSMFLEKKIENQL